MTTQNAPLPISPDAPARLSAALEEPAFSAELRKRAWAEFARLPMPSHEDEAWRRTDVSFLDLGSFAFQSPSVSRKDEPSPLFGGLDGAEEGLLLIDDEAVFSRLPKELADQGVVFTDLPSALRSHGKLLQERLGSAVPASKGKFEALSGALWDRGVFLYVPKGVDVRIPLRGGTAFTPRKGGAAFPRTVVIVEESARVTYFDDYASTDLAEGRALACGAVELFLAPNAEMTYLNIQRWGDGVCHFLTQNAVLGQNARLTTLAVAIGGKLSKVNLGSELVGQGATSQLYGLVFGDRAQQFTHHTQQDHRVPNTTSDLLFKAALKDTARSIYTGMIHIDKIAQKTSSYQANRNLLLSPTARANTIPMLEILADDVKCGHGATVGSLDDDQRFYLMSRGLSREESEHAIVEGFFEDVLQRIPSEATREKLRAALDLKLGVAQ